MALLVRLSAELRMLKTDWPNTIERTIVLKVYQGQKKLDSVSFWSHQNGEWLRRMVAREMGGRGFDLTGKYAQLFIQLHLNILSVMAGPIMRLVFRDSGLYPGVYDSFAQILQRMLEDARCHAIDCAISSPSDPAIAQTRLSSQSCLSSSQLTLRPR